MRILLVEDYPEVRSVIAEFLREEGHVVVESGDAVTSLRVLATPSACEAAIVDVVLPDGASGTHVADVAKQAGVPTLLYTGDVIAMVRLEERRIDHLCKPFDIDIIVEWIADLRGVAIT